MEKGSYSPDAGQKIQILVDKNRLAQVAYKQVIDKLKNRSLKNFFLQRLEERELFIREIEDELENLEIRESEKVSSAGLEVENWVNFKPGVDETEEIYFLEEIHSSDIKAFEDYDAMKSLKLPQSLLQKLERQQKNLRQNIENFKLYEQMFD